MKRPFSLTPRLQAVAELVPAGSRLVDVGTDHGRLPVWLLLQGKIDRAVATDLREKPLSKARELAKRWEITDRISFRLCDGLSLVSAREADVVTITGMGGETIADILDAAPWTREDGRRFILQPMTGADGLRRYLSKNGYVICREVLVQEGETLYVILLAEPGQAVPYSEGEIWTGRQVGGVGSPLRSLYLEQELEKLQRAAESLKQSTQPEDTQRQEYFATTAHEVERMKEEWDQWQQ